MRRDHPDATAPLEGPALSAPWPEGWSTGGVIAALEPLCGDERKARIKEVLARRVDSVTLALDGPHDPHNGAAVMRSCEAMGIAHLHVVAREPFLISHRVAQGTERWLEVATYPSSLELGEALERKSYSLVVADPRGQLEPEELAQIPRLAIALGNEHAGVSRDLARAASYSVRIPMRGFVESLNLSVSAAILLAAATRNRPGDLDPHEQERLYARGLYYSVIRAKDILGALPPA